MNKLNIIFLKAVRWSGWLLLPLALGFLLTGYGISGRYGIGSWVSEQQALQWHKLFHLPLILLLLGHVLPAIWLAMQRWGWIGQQPSPKRPSSEGPNTGVIRSG